MGNQGTGGNKGTGGNDGSGGSGNAAACDMTRTVIIDNAEGTYAASGPTNTLFEFDIDDLAFITCE